VPDLDVIELLGCHSCQGFYGNECDCTGKCDSGECNSTCLELVITMMLVSLVKPAWNLAPLIEKRYFVREISLAYHIKKTSMELSAHVSAKVISMKVRTCRVCKKNGYL
jgi:hypothetical protein